MTHSVTGIIAKSNCVDRICSSHPPLRAVPLHQEFSLFPLTKEIVESLGVSRSVDHEDLGNIPNELTDILSELSIFCPLLYFQTDYFGGEGSQLAMVFDKGMIIFGPAENITGPINEGLRLLGARTEANDDEFDSIGLGKYRNTDSWLKQV
jgi:hypothetical protein